MSRVRTLLIEDSGFMRIMISDMLRSDAKIDLIGTAPNGKEGVEKAFALNPDVIVTDMVMPEYDGLYVVKAIMKQKRTPIILLSSLERNDTKIFDALKEGAVDFFMKPDALNKNDDSALVLRNLVLNAAQADLNAHVLDVQKSNTQSHTYEQHSIELIAIGASTGGPAAIEYIVRNLPANLPIPVVIAQHMPVHFISTFAQRLNEHSPIPVQVAYAGTALKNGTIYIVSGEANAAVYRDPIGNLLRIRHMDKSYAEYNHPSVNCLFESVAETCGSKSIAVLLTGMGKDGATGLKKILDEGGTTVAQDEESSVVYGMPKVAVELGAAKRVIKLTHIPGFIVSCF
jgi:two-component system, chemotaxis family, protein-glutamate methylesterase/glutaminase